MVIRPAGWGDLETVAELLGTQSRAAVGVAGVRTEFLRGEWGMPEFAVGEDNVVAEVDGRMVGYAALNPRGELTLAAPDDAVADKLLARVVARAGVRGDGAIMATVLSSDTPLAGLVERHPFRLEHDTLLMWRPLGLPIAERRTPDGMAIRTFLPDDAEAVHRLLDEAYGAWDPLYVPMPHADWDSLMTGDPEFDADVWWVAEREGTLVGCALHWTSGWLKDVAVHGSERGQGLGATLVTTGLAEFARRRKRRVGLKVDAGNPTGALRLYEKLGFVTESREAVWTWSL
jgi:ribosomal protein S18 acetylase RimI-like enzyme